MASTAMKSALEAGASAVRQSDEQDGALAEFAPDTVIGEAKLLEDEEYALYSTANVMRTVRALGSALIGIAILVVVLVEIFSLDTITSVNDSDPFGGIITSLENTGSSALGLLVIGLLVLAANRVMGFFGGGGM